MTVRTLTVIVVALWIAALVSVAVVVWLVLWR